MYIRVICAISMLGLLLALGGFNGATSRLALQFLVAAAAGVVAFVALRGRRYLWAALFLIMFAAFNPVVPVLLRNEGAFWVDLAGFTLFALLLVRWKDNPPRQSVLSVVDPTPPRASL
jgi:hypothetical protein